MTWNLKYWDILDQLYWSPKYIGLRSIQKNKCIIDDKYVAVPLELVNPDGPLYTRGRKALDHYHWMRTQEETLNHVFDIAFAIAPDAMIERCLALPLGFVDKGIFQSLGREVRFRYGWGTSENITQHDGLFVSKTSIIGVEIKINSATSSEQILKYASLVVWEEEHSGRKPQVGLLYIVPAHRVSRVLRSCGLDGPNAPLSILDKVAHEKLPKRIHELLKHGADRVRDVLDRMVVRAISWSALYLSLREIADASDPNEPGGQTLKRLVEGLTAQIADHFPDMLEEAKTLESPMHTGPIEL